MLSHEKLRVYQQSLQLVAWLKPYRMEDLARVLSEVIVAA